MVVLALAAIIFLADLWPAMVNPYHPRGMEIAARALILPLLLLVLLHLVPFPGF